MHVIQQCIVDTSNKAMLLSMDEFKLPDDLF